jgi:NAD(P)H-dependent FMN reductase
MSQTRIVVLVGSLRGASISRQIAEAAVSTAPDGAEIAIYEGIADIPFYNEDIDIVDSVPVTAQALRDAVAASDGLLLVTPEYNGTLPAVLKNAIDWLSRPYGAGAIGGKPVAVLSGSISPNAAKWAHGDAVKPWASPVARSSIKRTCTTPAGVSASARPTRARTSSRSASCRKR